MNANRLLLTATALALLSACAVQRKPPRVAAPPPAPAPTPTPVPPPPPADWRDAAITPGTWSYREASTGALAAFGPTGSEELFSLGCERAASRIVLVRAGSAAGTVPLTVTTTTANRAFSATPVAGEPPRLSVPLSPRDPVLDAMAFSRGRFVIEVPGLPTLYLPAWPEVGRVIEDCR